MCHSDFFMCHSDFFMCHSDFFMCHSDFFMCHHDCLWCVNFINNFDIAWSSKWLQTIIIDVNWFKFMFLIIICYPVSYFWYWWPMKSLIGMADPIHHLIIFAMWVMIWMKERSNIYAFAISMAGPHGFVKIIHMYLRTADVWICWFARFAFVKPSCLHLQTTDFNASFGAALDFSQNNFCISQVQSSSFSDRWYPHLSEPVVFFTAHQSESTFDHPNDYRQSS